MRVLFFATIRDCTRAKETRWDEPTPTLGDLLCALSRRYGPAFERWVLEEGRLGPAIIVSVNGRDARHLDGVRTRLQPDDTVSIFPAIAGGHAHAAGREAPGG
jgi:MoaD family protein